MGRPWPRPGEPLFSPEDTDYALAWQAEQDEKCAGCGQPLEETVGREHEHTWSGKALTCWGCVARAEAEDDLPEGERKGALIYLTRRDI